MLELTGFVMPFFIDFINKNVENTKVRFVISLLSCLGIAVLFKFNELVGGDVESVLKSAGLIFAEAQAVYKLYWENSKARATLLK